MYNRNDSHAGTTAAAGHAPRNTPLGPTTPFERATTRATMRGHAARTLRVALLVASALTVARSSAANPGITGYSGKTYDGISETCSTTCHGKGAALPALSIDAPSALTAGQTASVTIVVDGKSTRTSLNAALSDGVTATAGTNTVIPFPKQTPGEIGATSPPPSGAKGTYTFTFVAPNRNGTIMLWVAGMAANGSGSGGDGVATTSREITITGATAPPPGDDDAGAPDDDDVPIDGGRDADAKAADDADETSSGSRGRRLASQDSGGCASSGSPHHGTSGWLGIAVIAALLALRRRHAPRQRITA